MLSTTKEHIMSDDIGPVGGSHPPYPQHPQPEHDQKEEKFDFSLPALSIGGEDDEDEGEEE
jgi:hypothetical protein